MNEDTLIIYGNLLKSVISKWTKRWLVIGSSLFVLSIACFLFFLPQTDTATLSLSIQKTGASISALSALTGQTQETKYIGILKSRLLAETVENHFHLKNFYRLHSERDAYDMLMNSISPNDNASDGLLYVTFSLPAPPRLALGENQRRNQVANLTSDILNLYSKALKQYYATSDNDRDSVLIRTGIEEVRKARLRYVQATHDLMAFIDHLKRVSPESAPLSASQTSSSPIQSLYTQAAEAQTEISALEQTQRTQENGIRRQLEHLSSLPTEDPLLRIARENAALAQANIDQLTRVEQLAAENPQVIRARAQMALALRTLQQQKNSYLGQYPSQYLAAQTKLVAQQARLSQLESLIQRLAGHLSTQRILSARLALLEENQQADLATLKAADAEYTQMRINTVSGKSRISVVDSALPPRHSKPGLLLFAVFGMIIAILPFFVIIFVDYIKQARYYAYPSASHQDSVPAERSSE